MVLLLYFLNKDICFFILIRFHDLFCLLEQMRNIISSMKIGFITSKLITVKKTVHDYKWRILLLIRSLSLVLFTHTYISISISIYLTIHIYIYICIYIYIYRWGVKTILSRECTNKHVDTHTHMHT